MVFLLTGADLLLTFVTLVLGVLVPWVYLGRKQSRRLKAFNSQLAATLQLMAGSLQAGLSLPQGMDTIVREGAEPMSDGVPPSAGRDPSGRRRSRTRWSRSANA